MRIYSAYCQGRTYTRRDIHKNYCEEIPGFLASKEKKKAVIHSFLVLTVFAIVPSAIYNVRAQP